MDQPGLAGGAAVALPFASAAALALASARAYFFGQMRVHRRRFRGMNFAIIIVLPGQLVFGQQQAAEAVAGAQFKLGVHLDGVERTDLDANLAAHAHRNINVEGGGIKLGLALVIRFLVLALDDVDALGRTFLLANLAGHAAQSLFPVVAVINQERETAGRFPFAAGVPRDTARW